jgi:hypothetical protein
MSTYKVARVYADPPYWATEIDSWAEQYGDKVVIRWATFRDRPDARRGRAAADRRDEAGLGFTHDGCELDRAARRERPQGVPLNGRYVLSKPGDGRKIDMAVVSVLTHEAAGDMTAAGWPELTENYAYF